MPEARGPRAESKGHQRRIRYTVSVILHALKAPFWEMSQGDLTKLAKILWLSEH